ncbi:MAG: oligosaccharide flippase family protein [Prolixibacteraceae bacterium]|nr:oligosaccharide flippase family protein [Prolixibacteraceae bacterium]
MKRKFVTNLILLVSLNLLIKPFWIFGIDRTVQNLVGDESYGLYFALFNFSMILNILLDAGITNYNNRNIAQYNFLLPKHLSNIIGLKLILAVVYTVFCLLTALIIGYNKIQFHILFFLIMNQFMVSLILYLRSNISALHLFRTDSLISVLDRTLMIIICSLLLFTNILNGNFNIKWFVYAQTLAYLLTAIITFIVVLHKSGKIKIHFNAKFFLVFLRKAYPYALLTLLMSLYSRIDSVLLERLLPGSCGREQAGIYAQAFRLLDAVSMFGVLVSGLLLPIFAKMIKQNESVVQMIKLSFSLLIVPAITIATTGLLYNREIMSLLYTSNTEHSADILGILLVGFIGIATSYIFGTLLTANGSMKQLNIMAFFAVILNVGMNLILIPRFQAYGSAFSNLTTQILTGIAQLIMAMIIFKMKPGYKSVLQIVIFIIIVAATGIISKKFDNWFFGIIFLVSGSLIMAFILKLLNLRNLFEIVANKQRY